MLPRVSKYHEAKAGQLFVSGSAPEITGRIQAIDDRLEDMARAVIRGHLDLSRPENASFLESPDAREQHQTQWHQWGILTHTRVFLRHYDIDIPRYLWSWGLHRQADEVLCQSIDGAARWDLLRASILLHDIGKFSARTKGRVRFHFAHHEDQSGLIIRDELDLSSLGFSEAQIDYVARTAQDHFVLGIVRKSAREQGQYNDDFAETALFRNLCLSIREEHPDDFVEIGVLFLGDSLAKVDPITGPERAVSQYDVNVTVARHYLDIVLHSTSL